ncbi:hypothetical protein ACWT_6867 [Actinoplanes sp. SE50]|uniref:hypothetical protein n=1 Tax=unclassified Actinoplanes TaxID=2626549 RepID=UPI00023ED507|nr:MULTISPECIES: hypothetical protein [unclassified Actinoplanes]AEV87878.1 hypothetical protein ACPL_6998 [Actinoplanes sp. SE50/110]ATO86282.1 hypothetical protein ACWT_6867 [Actinoplanes sp. SE50]SLM03697.1 hypothetical protein ACSP50_6996 [Actinoplanes sp. SE50/110]
MNVRDDPFTGGVSPRYRRIDRELTTAIIDAQCRDWTADRPDRVGFARLGHVRHEVRNAAARYRVQPSAISSVTVPVALAAVALVVLPLVLLIPHATRPLPLAAIAVAGVWAAYALRAGLRHLQVRRHRRAADPPAPIDDPFLYARLRRAIESCAAAARADRHYPRRAAAADLEYALDWLSAAQEELPRLR